MKITIWLIYYQALIETLGAVDWTQVLKQKNANMLARRFLGILQNAMAKCSKTTITKTKGEKMAEWRHLSQNRPTKPFIRQDDEI